MATQKISMGRDKDTDYQSKKRAAVAQANADNPYMWGLQDGAAHAATVGYGQASKATRDLKYGNVNVVTGDALDGHDGNFKPIHDAAGNSIINDYRNHTGYLDGYVSSTTDPQVDPELMGKRVQQRVSQIANGQQWATLNNRADVYGGYNV